MIETNTQKIVAVTPPAAIVNNASFVTATVDTIGFDYVTFLVALGATDIAMTALKVQESDAANMSGAADIVGTDFSVSPASLPTATDDNRLFAVSINMGAGRKRYLDLVATAGNGASGIFLTALAILSRAEVLPSSASDRGFTQHLIV